MCASGREGKGSGKQELSGKDPEAEPTLLHFRELGKAGTGFAGVACLCHKVTNVNYDHLRQHGSLPGLPHTRDSFSFLPGALSRPGVQDTVPAPVTRLGI